MNAGPQAISPLGFGCSELGSTVSYRSSCRLLEQAYVLGIRHFDLAPVYGDGLAEGIVGDVFGAARADVILVTKVGIGRPATRAGRRLLRRMFLPVKRALPGVWRTAASAAAPAPAARGQFEPSAVRASFSESLRLLRVDRVHGLLLHEAVIDDIGEGLIAELTGICRAGSAQRVGLATSLEATQAILPGRSIFSWVQVPHYWGAFSRSFVPPGPGVRATHRVLRNADSILATTEFRAAIDRLDVASGLRVLLSDSRSRSRLLLRAAVLQNRDGPVLASTSRLEHLSGFVAAAADQTLDGPANALNACLQVAAAIR